MVKDFIMALFRVFKAEKPRQFSLQHRYYDERKEKLDRMMKESSREESKLEYRERLREGWSRRSSIKSVNNGSNIRVIIIAALLILLVYFLY